ncbi:MAG: metallophosphoesterase [Chitinispirillaceae bacterium]|nr:metallophosphoesterase [Chitinispirillaceae bacterium]
MSSIKIIHLSDLHLFEPHFTTPLRTLKEKLIEMRKNEGDFDMLVITGDIRNKGNGSYEPAKKYINDLCNSLGISTSNIFIVPGNHDCNRHEVEKANWGPTAKILKELQNLNLAARKQSWPGFIEFLNFSACYESHTGAKWIIENLNKDVPSITLDHNKFGHGLPGFETKDVTIKGVPFRLIGVNSAITEVDGNTQPIAGYTYLDSFLDISAETLPLVALHHPIADLHQDEQKKVGELLNSAEALVLTGHIHTTSDTRGGINRDSSIELGAGSSKGQQWQDGQHCRVIEFDPDQEIVLLHDFIWWPNYGKWRRFEPFSIDWERWKKCCGPAKTRNPKQYQNQTYITNKQVIELGLYHIHNLYSDFKTPGPTLGKKIVDPFKDGTEIFIVGRSLVQLGRDLLGEKIADAILKHGYKCSFLIADPTRPDVRSLVEDYATVDVIRNTFPSMQEIFNQEEFSSKSFTNGYLEIYGIPSYIPDTYASYKVEDKRYCVLEPGIGVEPHKRPKFCFIDIPENYECVYKLTENIYRDILNHCRATQKPLFGMHIPPDQKYLERLERSIARRGKVSSPQKIQRGNSTDLNLAKGWFIGHFLEASQGLCRQDDVEIKYGIHQEGEERSDASKSDFATTIALLIKGKFRLEFPEEGRVEELTESGDFVIYQRGILHKWRVLSNDTVVVTIRWPSRVPAPL